MPYIYLSLNLNDMKKYALILLSLLIIHKSFAQYTSPYQLNLAKDIAIPAVSVGLIGTAFLLEKKRPALTLDQINALDRQSISLFDRNATYQWNTTAAKWSDGIMYGTGALPLLFLIDKRSRKDFAKVSTIYAEIFLVNVALTNFTKELSKRNRPYMYNPDVPISYKLSKDSQHSFFSGHTSLTAAMTFGFAQMYSDYFPNSPAKPGIWFAAAVVPLASAILRNRAGKHFWTDVIVGYIVGASVGILLPRLHLKKQ